MKTLAKWSDSTNVIITKLSPWSCHILGNELLIDWPSCWAKYWSVFPRDHPVARLAQLRALFWRIAMRPGMCRVYAVLCQVARSMGWCYAAFRCLLASAAPFFLRASVSRCSLFQNEYNVIRRLSDCKQEFMFGNAVLTLARAKFHHFTTKSMPIRIVQPNPNVRQRNLLQSSNVFTKNASKCIYPG